MKDDKHTPTKLKQEQLSAVQIVDYQPEYAEYFKLLNYEWLEKYFYIEAYDRKVLSDPQTYILDPGGYIFFAKIDEQIVGTCALMPHKNGSYELTKMAVTEAYKGRQIGKKLGLAVIEKAKQLHLPSIFLLSSTKLSVALNLYIKLGFRHVKLDRTTSLYKRSDVKMILDLY